MKDELEAMDHTGRLKLFGYRMGIVELLHSSDLFVFPSLQEGFPIGLLEAMAAELSPACSNIRGNTELVDEDKCLFESHSVEECKKAIMCLLNDLKNGIWNQDKIWQFD